MTRYERQKARQLVHLHAILVLLLEAHSGMTSTIPVLCLTTTVGTARATVERRAKTGGSKTRAVTTLHGVAGNVRVLGNTEATARSTGVAERGRIVLLQCVRISLTCASLPRFARMARFHPGWRSVQRALPLVGI